MSNKPELKSGVILNPHSLAAQSSYKDKILVPRSVVLYESQRCHSDEGGMTWSLLII